MKKVSLLFVTILVSSLFFSCRSLRVIDIETYNPSAITFPPEIKTIMIVNNSAQQPDHVGHRFVSNSKNDSILFVSTDSLAYIFCKSLGKAIAESPVFYDVRLCEDTLRWDSLYYNTTQFTSDEAISFCADYGVDALVSLDKLFFTTVFQDNAMTKFNFANKIISIQITGEVRVFWPGQKDVYVIPFVDSLSWRFDERDYLKYILEGISETEIRFSMLYASDITGQKMQVNFVPFWSEEHRWYYTNITSEWKQGTAFAAAEKWEDAVEIWEPLFLKLKKWKQKARLASNIALCNEMTGNFKKAIEYAEISYGLFKEYDYENSSYTSIQDNYINILKKRMEAEKALSEQLRETKK